MNFDHLRYLITAADCGSIHEAARQLMLKQQYISSVIKNLERHFDTAIFERTSRGILPTANGRYLIEKARQILNIYNEMEAGYLFPDNQNLTKAEETITLYMPAYLDASRVLGIIDDFNSYFPNCVVNFISKSPAEIADWLLTTENSLSLLPTPTPMEKFTKKVPDALTCCSLESVPLAVLAHKDNKKVHDYIAITIEQALKLDLVFLAPQGLAQSPIYAAMASFGTPNTRCTVDNPMLLYRMLKRHSYFGIGKATIAADSEIVAIPFQEPLYLRVFLLYNSNMPQSYALKSFIKLIQNYHKFF